MASLGPLGVVHDEPPDDDPTTFDYFGTVVRTDPDLSELDLADFFEFADGIAAVDTTDLKAMGSALGQVKQLLRTAIHPDDFNGFWRTARANRQELTDLFGVYMAVVEAQADRPTGRPADSTSGPPSIPQTSSPDVEARARVFLARRYPDRPDMQLAALVTVRGRMAAESEGPSQRTA